MQTFRPLLSLFILSSAVFCTYTMEEEKEEKKNGKERKRDRISRALKQFTMRPERRHTESETVVRKDPFNADDAIDPAPPNSLVTLPPAETAFNRLRKAHSDEDPEASEEHPEISNITTPRAPKNSIETIPPHLIQAARNIPGVPQPPPPSMLTQDKLSLTAPNPEKERDYRPLKMDNGELTPEEPSPPTLRFTNQEDANRPDECGRTPLSHAIRCGDPLRLVQLLILGANPRNGMLLHDAAMSINSSTEIARLLVKKYELDPNALDDYERTPLSHTILRGDTPMFVQLLDLGADPHIKRKGYSMLHDAAMSRNPSAEIVRLLVEKYKLDPDALDKYGRTPLSHTILRGDTPMFVQLLGLGANPRTKRKGNGMLHEAARSKNSSAEIIRLLGEKYEQDPNALNKEGRAPLHVAARSGTLDMFTAARSGTLDMFTVLAQLPNTLLDIISRERSTTKKQETRRTPLHILAGCRRQLAVDMAQILLQPGTKKQPADVYAEDELGRTPLQIAAQAEDENMVALLLHHTVLGHKSVAQAYAACTNEKIRARFEERSDIKPSPYCRTGSLLNSDEESEREESSSDGNDTDNEGMYVHTSQLLVKE